MKLHAPGGDVDGARSPPTRGRGLKPPLGDVALEVFESPPTRGRGLKLGGIGGIGEAIAVAPHAGARIETVTSTEVVRMTPGRPPRGGAD